MAALFRAYNFSDAAIRHPISRRRFSPARKIRRIPFRPIAAAVVGDGIREGIREFYDESSGLWESIWGDHMHHGFYDAGTPATADGHRSAQIRMIEEALRFSKISGSSSFLSLSSMYGIFFEFGTLAGYYRKFVERCSHIAPLNSVHTRLCEI
ncbi:hypothetical protein KSP40_PGU007167 [Platanthera guangdongensis]|uniref:Uncharacterized protein n=1 Tax=Platanthera guangdongensis TaxID=2320717 RepID=A0ABR2MHV7_9ASPA